MTHGERARTWGMIGEGSSSNNVTTDGKEEAFGHMSWVITQEPFAAQRSVQASIRGRTDKTARRYTIRFQCYRPLFPAHTMDSTTQDRRF